MASKDLVGTHWSPKIQIICCCSRPWSVWMNHYTDYHTDLWGFFRCFRRCWNRRWWWRGRWCRLRAVLDLGLSLRLVLVLRLCWFRYTVWRLLLVLMLVLGCGVLLVLRGLWVLNVLRGVGGGWRNSLLGVRVVVIVVVRGRWVIWVGVLRRHVVRGLRSETSNHKRFIYTERKLMRKRRRFQMGK